MSEPETGPLGQCVYAMSTGKRCPKDAKLVVVCGSRWTTPDKLPAYGYCHDHYFIVTKPRDQRIHRTAEPLIRAAKPKQTLAELTVDLEKRGLETIRLDDDGSFAVCSLPGGPDDYRGYIQIYSDSIEVGYGNNWDNDSIPVDPRIVAALPLILSWQQQKDGDDVSS